MLYQLHEMTRNLMAPWVQQAQANAAFLAASRQWWSAVPGADRMAAANELFHRIGKDYRKPAWEIDQVEAAGAMVAVVEAVHLDLPFCRLLHFQRQAGSSAQSRRLAAQPRVLVVAPLSGHHATLLRDTVHTLLRDHDVYVTDWVDARMVPARYGCFGLDDYVAYVRRFIADLGADNLHVLSVCQPTVPVLAAVSLMASAGEVTPRSLVMMGGPIDARRSPTAVNNLATRNPLSWFENNLIHPVPGNYPGAGRPVYPGFLQHAGFLAMNPSRHLMSHWDFYTSLIQGDQDDAAAHRRFYDEYNAVLDMPAEYYLDTIRIVFQQFLLPRGQWFIDGVRVDPAAITGTALLSIEGELDDIAGLGQTEAVHGLCTGVPAGRRQHRVIEGAGHYGIFSGRRWREQVYPQVRDFIASHQADQMAPRRRRAAGSTTARPRRAG